MSDKVRFRRLWRWHAIFCGEMAGMGEKGRIIQGLTGSVELVIISTDG